MIPRFSSPFCANRQPPLCNSDEIIGGRGELFVGEGKKHGYGYQTQLKKNHVINGQCQANIGTLSSITGLQTLAAGNTEHWSNKTHDVRTGWFGRRVNWILRKVECVEWRGGVKES